MGKRSRKAKLEEMPANPVKPVSTFNARRLWLALSLVVITLIAYAPVWNCGFVNFDDNQYVTENPHVTAGLTWSGMVWAATTGYAANWHPLTWFSHMLDVQLYGLDPAAHHAVNLALHLASTVLLYLLLVQMTQATWPSALVAALFAVHPLHVESVAWIAERKDVLSTLFWMLTMWAYVRYVRRPQPARYVLVTIFFAAGLLAKPMLVTLPFVLWLLDFWPLRRWTLADRTTLFRAIVEKIPWIGLSAISSVITVVVQQKGGAVMGVDKIPIISRVANAFVAYWVYLARMVWPVRLAALYPVSHSTSNWWFAAALGISATSILALRAAGRWPYVSVGWFWYLGTLLPVIGLVQVGEQATADRYTYVPLIGIFLIVAFALNEALSEGRVPALASGTACTLILVACVFWTREQVRYWTSSQSLWEHALAVTDGNSNAHLNLGSDLEHRGQLNEALRQYSEAVRIDPGNAIAHEDLGGALEHQGKLEDAIAHYSDAVRVGPADADREFTLGNALAKSNRPERLESAISHLTAAVGIKPDHAEAHNALGICYLMRGDMNRAIAEFSQTIRLKPDYGSAHNNLATALGQQGRVDEAISEYTTAIRLDPGYVDARDNLGILLARQGKTEEAIAQFSEVLRLSGGDEVAKTWLRNLAAKQLPPQ